MNTLALLIPGLLGPLPELAESNSSISGCAPLQKWLSRAHQQSTSASGYHDQLAQLFGVDRDFSITWASALYDGCDCSEGYWYRADPVHFKADIDHAILLDYHRLDIQADEASALTEAFNQHFAEDGLLLRAPHPQRWYLCSQQPLNIKSTHLHEAVGRNVQNFLPQGDHALNWRRNLNEAQMLFHIQQVNLQRAETGQLAINSLWLWGEGAWPQATDHAGWDWVMADDVVARGLAVATGTCLLDLDDSLSEQLSGDSRGLVVIDDVLGPCSYGDVSAWLEAIEAMCQRWIEPINKLIKQGQIDSMELYSGEGRVFRFTKTDLYKFWRKTRTLTEFINIHA